MFRYFLVVGTIVTVGANIYLDDLRPRGFLPRELRILRSILVDNDDPESEESFIESRDTLPRYPIKDYSPEIPYEFDGISDFEPKTNIRDKEYLRHSTLWSRQQLGDFIGISRDRVKPIKDEKQENQLPTYCNPPNPCPVGYTKENNCIEDFENTEAFSREFQNAQECMCDTEHMVDCSKPGLSNNILDISFSDGEFTPEVRRFEKNNPFFLGEKLPIAAKKGFGIGF